MASNAANGNLFQPRNDFEQELRSRVGVSVLNSQTFQISNGANDVAEIVIAAQTLVQCQTFDWIDRVPRSEIAQHTSVDVQCSQRRAVYENCNPPKAVLGFDHVVDAERMNLVTKMLHYLHRVRETASIGRIIKFRCKNDGAVSMTIGELLLGEGLEHMARQFHGTQIDIGQKRENFHQTILVQIKNASWFCWNGFMRRIRHVRNGLRNRFFRWILPSSLRHLELCMVEWSKWRMKAGWLVSIAGRTWITDLTLICFDFSSADVRLDTSRWKSDSE